MHRTYRHTRENTILVVWNLGHVAYCCFSHAFLLKFLDFSICLTLCLSHWGVSFASQCPQEERGAICIPHNDISWKLYHCEHSSRCFLQGIENVYTQHQPLLFQTIESIVKGRLRDIDYPFIGNHFQHGRFDLKILNSYHINSFTSIIPGLHAFVAIHAFTWMLTGLRMLLSSLSEAQPMKKLGL